MSMSSNNLGRDLSEPETCFLKGDRPLRLPGAAAGPGRRVRRREGRRRQEHPRGMERQKQEERRRGRGKPGTVWTACRMGQS